MKLKQADFRKLFRGECEPTALHPIGERVGNAPLISIEFLPNASGALDLEWINSIVSNPSGVEALLQKSFEEYCGAHWCGAEAKELVLELSDNPYYLRKAK